MLGKGLKALSGQSAQSIANEAGIDLGPRTSANMSQDEIEKLLYFQRGQAQRIDRQGGLFLRFEEYQHAEPLLVQAAQFWRNMEGDDSLQLAQALASLALLHEQCFRWSKAVSLREQATKIFHDAGKKSEHVQVLNENALAFRHTGKHREALSKFHESAKISEEVFGNNSGELGKALLYAMEENLALGEPLEALTLGKRCKEIREKRLDAIRSGPPPPPGAEDAEEIELTAVRLAIVKTKVALTMLEEADVDLRELLAEHRKIREDRALMHMAPPPHHAIPMLFFSTLQRLLGDVPGARRAVENCRFVVIGACGADSIDMAEVLLEEVEIDLADGNLPSASAKARAAVDIRVRFLEAEHPSVAKAMVKHAEVLAQSGEHEMAVEIGGEAARILSVTLGGSTIADAELCQRRMIWSMALGPSVEAAQLLDQAAAIYEMQFGEFHAVELQRRAALATLEARGYDSEAVSECITALAAMRSSLRDIRMDREQKNLWPRADYEYAITCGALCEVSKRRKKGLADAEDYLSHELFILEDAIGVFHPNYASAVLRRARLHEAWAKARPGGKELGMAEMFFNDAAALFCETTNYAAVGGTLEDRLWNIDRLQALSAVYVNFLFNCGMNFQEVPAWRCFEMCMRLRSLRFGCPEMFALDGMAENSIVAEKLRSTRRFMAVRMVQGPGKAQEKVDETRERLASSDHDSGDNEEEEARPLSEYAQELKLLKLKIEALRSELAVSNPALSLNWDSRYMTRGFSLVWRLPPGAILIDFVPFKDDYAGFIIEGQEPDRCGAFRAGPCQKISYLCKVLADAVLEEALVLEYRENIKLLPGPLRDGMLRLLDAMDSDDTPLATQIETKLRGARERFVAAGNALRKMLLGPMYKFRAERRRADEQVPPLKQIVICGDGPLLQLPWAALPESSEIDAKPLLHKHAFSTILSSVDLHRFSGRRTNPLLKRLAQERKKNPDEQPALNSMAKKRWVRAKVMVKGAVQVKQATSFVATFRNMEMNLDPPIFQYTLPRSSPRPKVLEHTNLFRTPPSYVTGFVHSDVLSMVWRYDSYPETNEWGPISSPTASKKMRSERERSPRGLDSQTASRRRIGDGDVEPRAPGADRHGSPRTPGFSSPKPGSPGSTSRVQYMEPSSPISPISPVSPGDNASRTLSPLKSANSTSMSPHKSAGLAPIEGVELFKGMMDEPPGKTGKISLQDPAFKSGYKASVLFCKRCITESGLVDAGDGLGVLLNTLLQGSDSVIIGLWRMPQNCVKNALAEFASAALAGKPRSESLQMGMKKMEESMRYCLLDGREMPGPAWAWAGLSLVGHPGGITPFDVVETATLADYVVE